MVESPKEPPSNNFCMELSTTNNITTLQKSSDGSSPVTSHSHIFSSSASAVNSTIINIDELIDVNIPRDTTNIFYDYMEPTVIDREIEDVSMDLDHDPTNTIIENDDYHSSKNNS